MTLTRAALAEKLSDDVLNRVMANGLLSFARESILDVLMPEVETLEAECETWKAHASVNTSNAITLNDLLQKARAERDALREELVSLRDDYKVTDRAFQETHGDLMELQAELTALREVDGQFIVLQWP